MSKKLPEGRGSILVQFADDPATIYLTPYMWSQVSTSLDYVAFGKGDRVRVSSYLAFQTAMDEEAHASNI